VKSLDTNILLYGTNADCAEHAWARPVIESLLAAPGEWVLADQMLLEYYRLIRNPHVLATPLDAASAWDRVRFFREQAGCLHCGDELSAWADIAKWLRQPAFPAARTFDLVLAATLRANGVRTFYTRNTRDFAGFGFFRAVNPEFARQEHGIR
jgi:toxin-antitoxin system PIN domain toxin